MNPFFTPKQGLEFILQLCVEDDERAGTILAVSNKCAYIFFHTEVFINVVIGRYYVLSAACALFKYTETKLNTRFAAASLRIKYVPVDGTMMIDPDTARNLELVGSMANKKSLHSLFGWVDRLICKLQLSDIKPERLITHIQQWLHAYYESIYCRLSLASRNSFSILITLMIFAAQSAIDARLDVVEGNQKKNELTKPY